LKAVNSSESIEHYASQVYFSYWNDHLMCAKIDPQLKQIRHDCNKQTSMFLNSV